jgi:aminoglycoside/choline kinase family phosphotransferase
VTKPLKQKSATEAFPSEDLIRFAQGYLMGDDLLWEQIAGDGSPRLFYRVRGEKGKSWVLMVHERPPKDQRGITENDSFLYIARHLREKGVPVPEVYHHDLARGWFIMEDLGERHLQTEALSIKGNRRQLIETYQKVIDLLILIQVEGREGFDLGQTHNAPYDQGFMLAWESGYFHSAFLTGYLGLDIPEEELREALEDLAQRVAEAQSGYFLYRDFQSRNIMVKGRELGLLDFQGARLGPLQYDLASLLLDPYVELEGRVQEELLSYYLGRVQKRITLDPQEFRELYLLVALHRNMQVLGAFAFLSQAMGREYFRAYIPPAVKSLRALLGDQLFAPYNKLKRVVFEEIQGI